MPRRILVALGLGLGVVLVAVTVSLLQRDARLVGTTGRGITTGVVVPGGKEMCQTGDRVPKDAGAVGLVLSTAGLPAGPLAVAVREPGGRQVTSGRTQRPFNDQPVRVPIRRVRRTVENATICVRNAGGVQVALLGDPFGALPGRPQRPAQVPGVRQPGPALVSMDWFRAGKSSWLDVAPVVAERFGLMKADFIGSWTLWAVLGLVVSAWAVAVSALLRAARP